MAALSKAGKAAKATARAGYTEVETMWLERKAAVSAASAAANVARCDAYNAFNAWDRVWWSAPHAAELAARKAVAWPPTGGVATGLPPGLCAHIQADADMSLYALDAMIGLWDDDWAMG